MSEKVIDEPGAKRALLHSGKATNESFDATADRFLRRQRYGEALEFLERTRNPELLEKLRAIAMELGDTFLLLRVERLGRRELEAEEWNQAAERALGLGKYYDAYRALTRAGHEERAEAIRSEHMPDYEPFRPEGK